MLVTKSMIKEYNIEDVVKQVKTYTRDRREYVIELSDGEIFATPYNFCTWHDYFSDETNQLMFHDYDNILSYLYDLIINCGSEFISIYAVEDDYLEPEFID